MNDILDKKEYSEWIEWILIQRFSARKKFLLELIGSVGNNMDFIKDSISLVKQLKYQELADKIDIDDNMIELGISTPTLTNRSKEEGIV